MAVSTSTAAWNGGTLIGAYGTCSEVLTELGAGASAGQLENKEFLMACGVYYNDNSSVTQAGAMWFSTKTGADWAT